MVRVRVRFFFGCEEEPPWAAPLFLARFESIPAPEAEDVTLPSAFSSRLLATDSNPIPDLDVTLTSSSLSAIPSCESYEGLEREDESSWIEVDEPRRMRFAILSSLSNSSPDGVCSSRGCVRPIMGVVMTATLDMVGAETRRGLVVVTTSGDSGAGDEGGLG